MLRFNTDFNKTTDTYTDGDIEDTILNIVKKNSDYTGILNSTNNWPIMYHLSPVRRNILDWYDFDKNGSLLEIGAGCGALTEMFLSKVRDVKSVELSKKRAEIIFERCRGVDNLEVIVGNINDISFDEKFDYVTLIGVLEYAGKFTQGSSSFKNFLEKAKSFLKPGGKLFIAIENKFGLKYWCGAREDHTGRLFDSIENYPCDKSIQTFGKVELEKLLSSAGFHKWFFYYPMPDYKLPKVIYSEDYQPGVDDLFDTYSQNFDQERLVLFNEREAFKNIIKNNNFPFFANSFLVEVEL